MPRIEAASDLLSDHSDRIGKLEDNYTEVSAQLAAQTVQIDQLGKDIANGVHSLSTKIDVVFAPLKVVQSDLDAHKDRLEELEKSDGVRKERKKAIRTGLAGVLVLGLGAVAKEAGLWIWVHWLSRLG